MVVLLRGETELARWPLPNNSRPDLSVIDQLARWQLTARRLGCSIRVHNTCCQLRALLNLAGLAEVLVVEVGGEPECGEEVGVQE
jgi:hypothetical protein